MGGVARHVDHLVVPVHDLDRVAARLEAAGFVVTPPADHPFGTSNRLVVFTDTYLELVAVTRPELIPERSFAAEVGAFLESGEGVSHVVVSSSDPGADHDYLAARGLVAGDLFEFSRPAPRADGSETVASFVLVRTVDAGKLGAFLCAHRVPEAVWHPSHLAHPNGASRLASIQLPAPAPPLFGALDVSGIEFGAATACVTTDGEHGPIGIGELRIA